MPLYPPYVGGCASYSKMLVKGFSEDGRVSAHVLLTEYSNKIFLKEYASKVLKLLPRRRSIERVGLTWSVIGFILYRLAIFSTLIFLKLFGYRVCHIHSSIVRKADIVLAKLMGYFVVVDVRDMYVTRDQVSDADGIIACSMSIYNRITEEFSIECTRYIRIPFDYAPLDELSGSHDSDNCFDYILYLGVISKNKGVHNLVDGYKRWRSVGGSSKLILAGPLQSYEISKLFTNDAEYVGALSHSDALHYLKNASLLVVVGGYEGMPRVIVEAVALNIPFLVVTGIEEVDSNCPFSVLPDDDAGSIASALEEDWNQYRCNTFDIDKCRLSTVVDEMIDCFSAASSKKNDHQ